MLLLIWVWRFVHQVAAQFADILYDVGFRSCNLGSERPVGELPSEHNLTSGVDRGCCAKTVCRSMIEWYTFVHPIAGLQVKILFDSVCGCKFASGADDNTFRKSDGFRREYEAAKSFYVKVVVARAGYRR